MRTGACNKDAAGPEKPHGPVVDFLVSAKGSFQAFLIFREGGRIEDDDIVAPAFFMPLPQEVEGVSLYALHVFEAVAFGVRPGQRHGWGENVNVFNVVARVDNLTGKPSGIAERIERSASCVAARRATVIAWVEVGSVFLARR